VECLSVVCVALCYTHLSVSELEVYSYSELHATCVYGDTKRKENAIHYCQILFVLNLFIINTVYNYILIVRTPECFVTLPFHSKENNIVLPR
jgi:hypothetical protein